MSAQGQVNCNDLVCHIECTDLNEDATTKCAQINSTAPVDHKESGDQFDIQQLTLINSSTEKIKSIDSTAALDNVLVNSAPASFIASLPVESPHGCKFKIHYCCMFLLFYI